MARIVLATLGSLGDLHPKIALGIELRRRGHEVAFSTFEGYAEKLALLGFEHHTLRPTVDPEDREFIKTAMDGRRGSEKIMREMIFPNMRATYDDLAAACDGADMMITGELIYAARSLQETTGIKWVTTCLSPMTMFSAHDPGVFPDAEFMEFLRPMPVVFHDLFYKVMRQIAAGWMEPYKEFRKELGLDPSHDPMFLGKFGDQLHLVMFSRALAQPQPDWPRQSFQTGFCFYDGQDDEGKMPQALRDFLDAGEPPIVFTLGSAAVMDPRNFFDESVKAAKLLGRRAVLLYGIYNELPQGLTDDIVGFDYAPYSQIFPRAACVVHQGGVGTTGQALRAGVPQLIMPYSHDQPDNAARCRRAGVAEVIRRDKYDSGAAADLLNVILKNSRYSANAQRLKDIVYSEDGTNAACNEIERVFIGRAYA
ncbi:MAG: glycosyltransferase family 1 protein [Acidobacteriota bacterium]|nr:MAG: glycosyltransferase family 1 protein [Acidobacteriota bacterium]